MVSSPPGESSAGETSSTIKFEIFIPKFSPSTPSTEVLFIGLSYALLVVNLKNLENLIFFALITLITTCDGTRVRLSIFF